MAKSIKGLPGVNKIIAFDLSSSDTPGWDEFAGAEYLLVMHLKKYIAEQRLEDKFIKLIVHRTSSTPELCKDMLGEMGIQLNDNWPDPATEAESDIRAWKEHAR